MNFENWCNGEEVSKGVNFQSLFFTSKILEFPRWEIFMEQELRFGLDLGRFTGKKTILADYEQLSRAKKKTKKFHKMK